MENGSEFGRFDVPKGVREFLDIAIDAEIVDGADIVALVVRFRTDWGAIAGEIVEYAFCARHYAPEKHEAIVPANDALHATLSHTE